MKTSALLFACLLLAISYAAKADATPQGVKQTEQLVQSDDEVIQLRSAAELGDANAMFKLGEIYSYGDGVTEDANIAVEWYIKAAQAGHAEAMYKLGDMYYFGKGVTEDTNETIIWYTKAANAGYSEAMYELGDMYYYGWGVREDPNKAEEWYSKAFRSYRKDAEAGDSDAMQKVAKMYESGEGVTKDYTQALQWYNKAAAEAGNSDAMYRIGLMYENGKGIGKDYEQAKSWYKKAIELGNDEAKMRLVVIFVKEYYKVALWGFLAVLVLGGFIYAAEDKGVKLLDIDARPKEWTIWMTVRRYVGSQFIYIIYWLTLWGAMKQVVGATLSPDKAKEQVEIGAIESVWEYGWGGHYIWFLIAFCFVTFCSAALAGATAKKKGALVASIANLPVIIFTSLFCWFLYIAAVDLDVENPVAWKIIFPLSILGSIFFPIVGGLAGEKWQNSIFNSNTVFGIRPLHWWWLIFPLHFVIQVLVPKIVTTLGLLFGSTLIKETKYSVLLFLLFVAFATFIYFILWGWFKTFRLLSMKHKTNLGKGRIILRVLFYLWGIPLLFDVFCILISISFR